MANKHYELKNVWIEVSVSSVRSKGQPHDCPKLRKFVRDELRNQFGLKMRPKKIVIDPYSFKKKEMLEVSYLFQ